jgi:hypothetical protein
MSKLLGIWPSMGNGRLGEMASAIESLLGDCELECEAAVSRISANDHKGFLVELKTATELDALALQSMRVFLAPRLSKLMGERISARRLIVTQRLMAAPPVQVGPEEMRREIRRARGSLIHERRASGFTDAQSSFFGMDVRTSRSGVDVDDQSDASSEFLRLSSAYERSNTYKIQ